MKVGIVGLGKLGLPVACAMASRGVQVFGYDKRPEAMRLPEDTSHEEGLAEAIEAGRHNLRFVGLTELVLESEVIFVAVETPHEPRFEGVTPLPDDRADFDYTALKAAVSDVERVCRDVDVERTVAVISTVLPGTMAREIEPLLGDRLKLVYTPSFIAMGTTVRDFLDPEFVLVGGDDDWKVDSVYAAVADGGPWQMYPGRTVRTTIQNAELIKVSYNTFIGLKIAFANTLMEVCHKTGCDVDEVTGALKLANRRLVSPAYMDGGMGDGGACHPRDNIALSWLARELNLSFDLFGAAMECREAQARWLADLMHAEVRRADDRPMHYGILGLSYKPGSALSAGSAGMLVYNLLKHETGEVPLTYEPTWAESLPPRYSAVFLVGCKHPEFRDLRLPTGSVVIDPFRYIPDQEGVEVIRVGQWAHAHTDSSQASTPPLAA